MPAPSGGVTRPRTPRTAVLPRPLQYCQVPAPSGGVTRRLVPRARRILLPRPLQHLQVPALCGLCTRARAPRAGRSVLPPRPLQHFQVPALSGYCTCPRLPRAPVRLRPSQLRDGPDERTQLQPNHAFLASERQAAGHHRRQPRLSNPREQGAVRGVKPVEHQRDEIRPLEPRSGRYCSPRQRMPLNSRNEGSNAIRIRRPNPSMPPYEQNGV